MPAVTGSGVSVFVTDRSAAAATLVVAVSLSLPTFGSAVEDEIVAVLEIVVPPASAGSTARVSVKMALPGESVAIEQTTDPVLPGVGVVHDHPPG